ncbi:MAG TPA: DUF481 domain-containing protein [Bryobacteraceae bacterium]|jgi:hypothetical protein|nr:DUF481 domain-containing protein [Bryobacteraceae bacterium]
MLLAQIPRDQDVLLFGDGERLVGRIEHSSGSSVTFKSDVAGEVTVDWSKVQEVHTDRTFALIPKGVRVKRHSDTTAIPEGTLSVAEQKLTVTPASGPPASVAVAEGPSIVDDAEFKNAVNGHPGIFSNWKGAVTAGASLVEATQKSRTFTGAVSLARLEPTEDWMARRNRTSFDFSGSYGTISQPNTPEVKTDIFHLGVERDEYLSNSVFVFAEGLLDHNFSQDLRLQQTYGGGVGWSIFKRDHQSLDLKGGVTYIHQQFSLPGNNQSLIGALVEEDYARLLGHGMRFSQKLILDPALNNSNALSGTFNALLTLPMYKRLNASLGVIDNYLHDPPPGFKKNSFEFTAGLTYAIQ